MRPLFPKNSKRRLPAIVKLKRAVLKIGHDGGRDGVKLAERVFKAIPELRRA